MKILSSASARPNFVKLAAVHRALASRKDVTHVIVHTGQHYDPLLSDIFFRELNIGDPAHNLGVKGSSDRETTIQATADASLPVFRAEKPDIVLVYGDVNGAVGAARAAKTLGIRIGHVEAGLRSGDRTMPEELNRIEIDRRADDLFITEASAARHIEEEGLSGSVHFVGNTMIDTLMRMTPAIAAMPMPAGIRPPFVVATLHRPSNVDDPVILGQLVDFLRSVSEIITVVLPVHPRLKSALRSMSDLSSNGRLILLDPLGYLEFMRLTSDANFVLTDSGGLQEEATYLRKRCFTMRRNTERPSTIDSGSNTLIDPANPADRAIVLDAAKHPKPAGIVVPPLWDGMAGERIAQIILRNRS